MSGGEQAGQKRRAEAMKMNMPTIATTAETSRGAFRLVVTSIVARLPLAMFSVALLVHIRHLSSSFAAAGIAAGAYAAAVGIGGPLLERLVDRYGQPPILVGSATATENAAVAVALLPARPPMPSSSRWQSGSVWRLCLSGRRCVRFSPCHRWSGRPPRGLCGRVVGTRADVHLAPPLALAIGVWTSGATVAAAGIRTRCGGARRAPGRRTRQRPGTGPVRRDRHPRVGGHGADAL